MIIIIKQQKKNASIRLRELNFTIFILFFGSEFKLTQWEWKCDVCVVFITILLRVRDWVIIKVIIFVLNVRVQSP